MSQRSGIARGTNGHSYRADHMLPKERAHLRITWQVFIDGRWVYEDKGEVSSTIRGVWKKRHRKKSRAHGKRVIEEQQS